MSASLILLRGFLGLNFCPSTALFTHPSHFRISPYFQETGKRLSRFTRNKMVADEDVGNTDKWERMYSANQQTKHQVMETLNQPALSSANALSARSEVKVVTFDLDDTIWRTGDVIDSANNALQEYLNEKGINQPRQVKDVMRDLFERNSTRYCPELATNPLAKVEPVLLTLLRQDAISNICVQDNGFSFNDAEVFAEESFDIWTTARHDAIPSHLAESVTDCLDQIRSLRTSLGHPVIIGAITNGNSDPRRVPMLESYFDFCINSEDVGMAKPSPEIYKAAVKTIAGYPAVKDLFLGFDLSSSNDNYMDTLGPWWVHIGDDFLKDVIAAKDLGMRTVWARELVLTKEDNVFNNEQQSNRTVQDLVNDLAKQDVIKMEIGSRDYLETSITDDFADTAVDEFLLLSRVVTEWHLEGTKQSCGTSDEDVCLQDASYQSDPPEYFDIRKPDASPDNAVDETNASSSKFCIFCGTKLPSVAKFCRTCGEAQG